MIIRIISCIINAYPEVTGYAFYLYDIRVFEMEQYKGIVKTRTPERKIMLVVVTGIILFLSYQMRNYLYMIMAVVMMTAVFYTKEHIVDKKGVHIVYNFFGIKIPYTWTWDVITIVRPDYTKAKPNVLLEIAKDVTIRGFVFKKSEVQDVMDFIKRMNPNIHVEDFTEEEAARAEEERKLKMQYAMQRQKASKKLKKK